VTAGVLPAITGARARTIAGQFGSLELVVVGDVMLDRFVIGRVTRISPEAPVPVVLFDREESRLGGAANVAQNIAALGGAVTLIGVVGADAEADLVRQLLADAALDAGALVIDSGRRTTAKMRVVTTRNQQVARVDFETDHDVGDAVADAVAAAVESRAASARAIVVSDYQKGLVTRRTMAQIAAMAHAHDLPLLVDPKVPHMDFYRGSTLVTPNLHEAELASHVRIRTPQDAARAAALLRERIGADGILITLGEQGMWLSHAGVEGALAAAARDVADVTGAGDTVIAALALALAAGASSAEAAQLANQAAGIVVGKFGAATVTVEELLASFVH
jgi:D-beta-D-heptose 7-phosphate kinase/D-beta-D-heptose 1-phosphate adenosyltransferase